ncbi:cytochrome c [Isosphaeraceae bacterium EP7]
MLRKWSVLAAMMAPMAALTVGLAWADDDASPLHKMMETVNKKNNEISKGVRSPVNFKKAQADVVKAAKELSKLGKEFRDDKTSVAKSKEPGATQEKWVALMDDFVKVSDKLAEVSEKEGQAQAKEAHTAVKKSCSECHKVFRVDE